jgi:hypothetical protein
MRLGQNLVIMDVNVATVIMVRIKSAVLGHYSDRLSFSFSYNDGPIAFFVTKSSNV